MSSQNSKAAVLKQNKAAALKQKAVHEFVDFFGIALYLAFFFCAVMTYRMILLHDFQDAWLNYSFALINALVIGKVILIGEIAHLGKKYEEKPLLFSSVYKAFMFSLLTGAFHIVEDAIKRLLHGENVGGVFHGMRIDDALARTVVVFCTFIPLFAFRELRRVIGEDKFNDLFFHPRASKI